jgi:hypothetical protein
VASEWQLEMLKNVHYVVIGFAYTTTATLAVGFELKASPLLLLASLFAALMDWYFIFIHKRESGSLQMFAWGFGFLSIASCFVEILYKTIICA